MALVAVVAAAVAVVEEAEVGQQQQEVRAVELSVIYGKEMMPSGAVVTHSFDMLLLVRK